MQVFSSSCYFPVPSAGFWKIQCLLLAARARKSLDRSLGKRKFAIHQRLSKGLSLPATLLPLPGLPPPCIMFTHRRVENIHLSHCTAPSALKDPKKHEGEKKKKEPESAEIKNGKQLKVFISKCEYLKHHSLLSPPVNEGTGKVSSLCQKMETWQVPWTVLSPAGPETAETTLSSGPDPAANMTSS